MIHCIQPGGPLAGGIPCPGDKSMSHRYALIAAIARGKSQIRHYAASRDCQSTLNCLRRLGVEVDTSGASVIVVGRGIRGLQAPGVPLDAGNSGTTMRLLSGLLAGQSFQSVLAGDESLSRRPMERIIQPLRLMGADIHGDGQGGTPPLTIRGGNLHAIRYTLPVASAQVKSCVLLAGLHADGVTAVEESIETRDHTEIALRHFGGSVSRKGAWIEIVPGAELEGCRVEVPADLSGAAFFIIAASLVPGSLIRIPDVGLNPKRRVLVDYLVGAGVSLSVENESERAGEARGDLVVRCHPSALGSELPAIRGATTAALIDEIPVLAVFGSQAGGLEIRDARELRFKESDRIKTVVKNLRAMGAEVDERTDGFTVAGGQRLKGADILTHGDHRIAMAFAIAGLAAAGETRIHDAECADVSFPGFYDVLERSRSGRRTGDPLPIN